MADWWHLLPHAGSLHEEEKGISAITEVTLQYAIWAVWHDFRDHQWIQLMHMHYPIPLHMHLQNTPRYNMNGRWHSLNGTATLASGVFALSFYHARARREKSKIGLEKLPKTGVHTMHQPSDRQHTSFVGCKRRWHNAAFSSQKVITTWTRCKYHQQDSVHLTTGETGETCDHGDGHTNTAWCSEIGSLMSDTECIWVICIQWHQRTSLHQAVHLHSVRKQGNGIKKKVFFSLH